MRFEERLARTVASVLGLALLASGGACGGDKDSDSTATPTGSTSTGTPGTATLAAMCTGGIAFEDYFLALGYVEIAPGGDCPDAQVAQLSINSCTFYEWQGITCGFDRVDLDQVWVDDGYGGYHVPQGNTPPSYTDIRGPMDVCWYEAVWYRDPNAPTCGRPLLREGEPVVARVQAGAGWGTAPIAAVADRQALAEYWLSCAVMEHASVASFSHFSLDLMRLGAPPDLLRGAHQAALDEIEHARLCFALASAYSGTPVQPGALDAPVTRGTRLQVAEALFREGCIGETLAAIDAAARLRGSKDPAVREALEVILRDESDHAALAWRTLHWMLDGDESEAIRARLSLVLAQERARWTTRVEPAPVSDEARAHGLLDPAERTAELRRAWNEVIAPAWEALA